MQAPHSPPRRLSREDRRAAILDAALPLFARDGFARTSVGQVAAASGVSKPVLYDHFDSKRDLYVALIDGERERFVSTLMSVFDPAAPLDERLAGLARRTILHVRRRPDAARLLFGQPTGDPVAVAAHARLRALLRRHGATLILADPAFVADPGLSRQASAELHADLQSALLERLAAWALERPRISAEALTRVFVDVVWNGLGD
jgi:AcrR family transcriptional regulator